MLSIFSRLSTSLKGREGSERPMHPSFEAFELSRARVFAPFLDEFSLACLPPGHSPRIFLVPNRRPIAPGWKAGGRWCYVHTTVEERAYAVGGW